MVGPSIELKFSVKGHTKPGEIMCVVGDCPELGNWNAHKAKVLVLERCSEEGEVWSKTVKIPVSRDIQYRYFIAHLREAEHEGEERDVMVKWWETNLRPRRFSIQAYCTEPEKCDMNVAEFGYYDGVKNIDKGWLTEQTEIHIRLHSNPIYMWKSKHRQQMYRIKCTPLDLRHRDLTVTYEEDEESNHDLLSAGSANKIYVSVLNGELDEPDEQHQFGTIYRENDYMIFRVQTFEREFLGYQFDFFVHDPNGGPDQAPKHVGNTYILPQNLRYMHGVSTMPINGLQHKPIGQITFDYLIIKPLQGYTGDMRVSYSRHWKRNRRPLDVGHRGMGSTYKANNKLKQCESVRENTIHSLSEAGGHGADFVEFDVQLSKDKIPVIYHDFTVSLTLKKKQSDELDWFDIPVNELNLEQLQMLKLDHVSEKTKGSPIASNSVMSPMDPAERQPFPTLRKCLEILDPHIGLNIEIKYCMHLKTGELEDGLKYFLERNDYVDIILREVLQYAGERRIVFSCFDPDICTFVRLKQNRYPVSFLTQGATLKYPDFNDLRTRNVLAAYHFAKCERLLGVNPHTEDILKDFSIIRQGKDMGLVLFCWGEDNNSKDTIKKLKEMGIDGVIYDSISELKETKENIFKMEKEAKLQLLRTVGALTNGSAASSPGNSPTSTPGASSDIKEFSPFKMDRSYSEDPSSSSFSQCSP